MSDHPEVYAALEAEHPILEIRCKECGKPMQETVLTVFPPIHVYTCKPCKREVKIEPQRRVYSI